MKALLLSLLVATTLASYNGCKSCLRGSSSFWNPVAPKIVCVNKSSLGDTYSCKAYAKKYENQSTHTYDYCSAELGNSTASATMVAKYNLCENEDICYDGDDDDTSVTVGPSNHMVHKEIRHTNAGVTAKDYNQCSYWLMQDSSLSEFGDYMTITIKESVSMTIYMYTYYNGNYGKTRQTLT
jgi:hypothetical protein